VGEVWLLVTTTVFTVAVGVGVGVGVGFGDGAELLSEHDVSMVAATSAPARMHSRLMASVLLGVRVLADGVTK
jgi:hypothetical protein